jgi:hypothetical protein
MEQEIESLKPSDYVRKLHSAISTLAEINAIGERDSLTEEQIQTRRIIIDALWKLNIIEFEEPKESGRFAFKSAEEQEIYLETYKKAKNL